MKDFFREQNFYKLFFQINFKENGDIKFDFFNLITIHIHFLVPNI